jgi:RNA polymerase sigma factor (sigma-70 family)
LVERNWEALVSRAVQGDETAWTELVRGLSALVLTVARAHRLGDADAWDVSQDTWVTLTQQLGTVRDMTCLPGWLATTARRRALGVVTGKRREVAISHGHERSVPSPEMLALGTERDRALWKAVEHLPERYRRLLWLLAHRPELTYPQIAAELGIRPGSVGPLRRRSLDRLRNRLIADGFDYP